MRRRAFFGVLAGVTAYVSARFGAKTKRSVAPASAGPETVLLEWPTHGKVYDLGPFTRRTFELQPGTHTVRVPTLGRDGFGSHDLVDSGFRDDRGRRIFALRPEDFGVRA